MDLEVRNDDDGKLDEIVGNGCYVHLERLSSQSFMLIVDDGKRCLRMGLASRGGCHLKATITSDEPNDMCMTCLYSLRACRCGTAHSAGADDAGRD